jgi:hypothetical protein
VTEPQPSPSEEDRKQALLDAAQAALADAKNRADRADRQGHSSRARFSPLASGFIASAIGLYLLVARPAWFLTPPPPPDPPEIAAASVRLTLVREASLVQRFQADSGRLPVSMAEAGSAVAGVQYDRLTDSSYVLRAVHGLDTVRLSSRDSVPLFLGNSLGLILSRSQP